MLVSRNAFDLLEEWAARSVLVAKWWWIGMRRRLFAASPSVHSVECDRCGERSGENHPWFTSRAGAIGWFRKKGWHVDTVSSICPTCLRSDDGRAQ